MTDIYGKAMEAYKLIFGKCDLDSFDARLKFQKTIYLLKAFGINFQELKFTWYKRGPYCFDLSGAQYKASAETGNLSEVEVGKIKNNKNKISSLLSDPSKAELFSSVTYLYKDEKLTGVEIIKKMSLVKPWFKKEEIENTIKKVKEFLSDFS